MASLSMEYDQEDVQFQAVLNDERSLTRVVSWPGEEEKHNIHEIN